jgi:hypothetical protein
MKNVLSYLALVLILINCQEPKENLTENKFSKNVGQKIPNEVATRWAERYRQSNRSSKIQNTGSITVNTLVDLTTSLNDYNGIVFHHALDNDGQYHTLLIPFTEGSPLWSATQVVDSDVDSIIDPTIAKEWAENFIQENQNEVWSHFFGRHVFDEILSRAGFEQIEMVHGRDDLYQVQILLYVTYVVAAQNGRSKGEAVEVEVYDKSNPCPNYCAP